MEERMIESNRVVMIGEIVSDFVFTNEVFGEKFYTANLSAERASGVADVIPITVSDRLIDMAFSWKGQYVQIEGQFRSFNKRSKLMLFVFVKEIETLDYKSDTNYVYLDGYVCKNPKYRTTPLDRKISDVLVAVNRQFEKSDYIPCICWGRNARFAGNLEVGSHVILDGRIQSREYKKKISDDEYETRVAYEVSASTIKVIEDKETEDNEDERRD